MIPKVYEFFLDLAWRWLVDQREIEGINSQVKHMSKRAPNMSWELLASRLVIKRATVGRTQEYCDAVLDASVNVYAEARSIVNAGVAYPGYFRFAEVVMHNDADDAAEGSDGRTCAATVGFQARVINDVIPEAKAKAKSKAKQHRTVAAKGILACRRQLSLLHDIEGFQNTAGYALGLCHSGGGPEHIGAEDFWMPSLKHYSQAWGIRCSLSLVEERRMLSICVPFQTWPLLDVMEAFSKNAASDAQIYYVELFWGAGSFRRAYVIAIEALVELKSAKVGTRSTLYYSTICAYTFTDKYTNTNTYILSYTYTYASPGRSGIGMATATSQSVLSSQSSLISKRRTMPGTNQVMMIHWTVLAPTGPMRISSAQVAKVTKMLRTVTSTTTAAGTAAGTTCSATTTTSWTNRWTNSWNVPGLSVAILVTTVMPSSSRGMHNVNYWLLLCTRSEPHSQKVLMRQLLLLSLLFLLSYIITITIIIIIIIISITILIIILG